VSTVESLTHTATEDLRSRALAAANGGHCDEALSLLETAIATDPARKFDLLCDIAAIALRGGDLVQAIHVARHVISIDPADESARFTLAMALAAIGSFGEALELFDTLNRDPVFQSRSPGLAALAATESARLRSMRVATAVPAQAAALVECGSMRQFIWGVNNPFDNLPKRLSPDGVGGWYSDHPVFEQLIRARRPKRLVEVGSLLGASAIHIAAQLKTLGVDGELTCVDTFLGSREHFFDTPKRDAMLAAGRYQFLDEFLGNVSHSGCERFITPFPQSSTIAARIFREGGRKFDFVYLDASHEYADVLNDLREWWPLVDAGGVLVGDDFEEPWFGVIRAALEFADEIGQKLELSTAFASSPVGGRENTKFILTRA
jgi:SAM-dependent methyltransferase